MSMEVTLPLIMLLPLGVRGVRTVTGCMEQSVLLGPQSADKREPL